LNIIKRIQTNRIIKKRLNDRASDLDGFERTKNILILFDVQRIPDVNFFSTLIKNLEEFEIQVEILGFKPKKNKKKAAYCREFYNADFGLDGLINAPNIKPIFEKTFDVLINYFDEAKWQLIGASLQIKNHFSVGFPELDKRLNDLIVNTGINERDVFEKELIKYLKLFKKI